MSKEFAALAHAMQTVGAIRVAVHEATTGKIVAEYGASPTPFGASLVPLLCDEMCRLTYTILLPAVPSSTPGGLCDVVLQFRNRSYIVRPLFSNSSRVTQFIQLDLDGAIAQLSDAQARLAEAAAQLAPIVSEQEIRRSSSGIEINPSLHSIPPIIC